MLSQQKQKKVLGIRIENKQIDICPLCNKQLKPKNEECARVQLSGKMLFYAHLECIKIFNAFVSRARKELL